MGLFSFSGKRKQGMQLKEALGDIQSIAFPGGNADIQHDAQAINSISNGKIADSDLNYFTIKCKTLLYVAEDKSNSQRFIESYVRSSDNKITSNEAIEIYNMFLKEYTERVK